MVEFNETLSSKEVFEEKSTYLLWYRQDNTMKNWSYSSVSISFLKYLIGKSTTTEYCTNLAKEFNDDFQVRLMDIR